jgi:hypothetical protein
MKRCDAFYDLPSVKDKRTAGIGKGEKLDFTKFANKYPAPGSYTISSSSENNL